MAKANGDKAPKGRPSNYTDAIASQICDMLAEGTPLTKICKREDMPHYSTVLRWQRDNADFCDVSTRAKAEGAHALADQALEIADNSELDPQDRRIRIDTRLRLIGKWNSGAYGEKVAHDHSGSIATPVNADEVRTEIESQLARLAAAGAAAGISGKPET